MQYEIIEKGLSFESLFLFVGYKIDIFGRSAYEFEFLRNR